MTLFYKQNKNYLLISEQTFIKSKKPKNMTEELTSSSITSNVQESPEFDASSSSFKANTTRRFFATELADQSFRILLCGVLTTVVGVPSSCGVRGTVGVFLKCSVLAEVWICIKYINTTVKIQMYSCIIFLLKMRFRNRIKI